MNPLHDSFSTKWVGMFGHWTCWNILVLKSRSSVNSFLKIAFKVAEYIDKYCDSFAHEDFKIIRHILGLYNGMPGSKTWRTKLVQKTTDNHFYRPTLGKGATYFPKTGSWE